MPEDVLLFDGSPLNYFCRAGLLKELEALTTGHPRFVTRAVRAELTRGVLRDAGLQEVLDADWLGTVGEDMKTLTAFSQIAARIGRTGRNLGEASVLAWALVHGAVAVLDDQTGYRLAERKGIKAIRSLTLIARGVREGVLTPIGAQTIVDLLRDSEAYFPCSGAEFMEWANGQGIL